jgi:hypothetical protein
LDLEEEKRAGEDGEGEGGHEGVKPANVCGRAGEMKRKGATRCAALRRAASLSGDVEV